MGNWQAWGLQSYVSPQDFYAAEHEEWDFFLPKALLPKYFT